MIDWLPTDRLFWDLIPTELGNFIPIIWVAKGYDIIRSRPGEDKHNIDRYPHIYPVPWGAKESLTIDMMIREIDIDGLQKEEGVDDDEWWRWGESENGVCGMMSTNGEPFPGTFFSFFSFLQSVWSHSLFFFLFLFITCKTRGYLRPSVLAIQIFSAHAKSKRVECSP